MVGWFSSFRRLRVRLVLLADEVLLGHHAVLVGHVGRARGAGVLGLHDLRSHRIVNPPSLSPPTPKKKLPIPPQKKNTLPYPLPPKTTYFEWLRVQK